MSKDTLKYEYIKPTNIESEVPEKQEIRESKYGNTTESNNDNTEQEKENFVPVLTIKKEETALTKGDFKLQKVMVTENVAEEYNSNTTTFINPLYSEVQSATIIGPQPIRESPKDNQSGDDNKEKIEEKDKEHKKLKTKIPTLRLKQTVEKVKKERNISSQAEEKVKQPIQGRRSSIPKLRRRRYSKSIEYSVDANKENNSTANKEETNAIKPDEEFNKLYDEIVNDKLVEVVADKMLPEKIENPDELETSFEAIIHAYDDNKIEPVTIGSNKSKIPLSKQKSLHEERLPRQVERRLSIKGVSMGEKEKQNESPLTNRITNKDVSTIPVVIKDEHKLITTEEDVNKTMSNDTVTIVEENGKPYNKTKMEHDTPQNSDVNIKILNNEIKEAMEENPSHKDIPSTNMRFVRPDDKNEASLEHSNSKLPDSSKMVMDMFRSNDEKKVNDSFKDTKLSNEVDKTILKEEGDSNPNGSHNTTSTKDNLDEFIPKRSILSKIALFQGKEALATKQNNPDKIKKAILKQGGDDEENHITINNDNKTQENNETNDTFELRNKESIEISHKNEKNQCVQNVASIQEDFIKLNDKKDNTAINATETGISKAANSIEDINNEEKIVHEEFSEAKGKIGSTISRIDSNETKLAPKKKTEIEVLKHRSVFSKIAMFERQSSKEPLKVKEEVSKNNVQIHTIKEININDVEHRKPKIIDSVLKSQPLRKSLIEDSSDTPISSTDFYITDTYKINKDMSPNDVQEIKPIETNALESLSDAETEQPDNGPPRDEKVVNIFVSKKIRTFIEDDLTKVSKTENLDNKYLNSNIERSKSVIESELGDTVKGKVHQLVVRMNSSEKMDVARKEVIPVRERPRKNSVSNKIALFERKLTPVNVENTKATIALNTQESTEKTTEPSTQKNDKNSNKHLPKTLTEEEYKKRIEELEKAREVYGTVENMPYVQLRNGRKMPVLAVGTALLDPHLIQPIIKAAIDLGYRAIDSAFIYGNEKEIGEAIKAKIEDGTVTRDDLFIINKLWNSFHRQDLVEKACRDSLAAMGLDYFDLYLVHSPISFKEGKEAVPMIANVLQYSDHDYMEAWFGMEELVKKGLAKSIGVSNFNAHQLARVDEKAQVKPVINQVECHPYLTQQRLKTACADRGVKLCCFGVLGSKGTPSELKTNLMPVIDDPLVMVMAAGLNVTAAQLLIRYQIDSGHLAVVKASSAAHLANNLKALNFELTPAQLNALNSLNQNRRTFTFKGMGDTHRNYPFKEPF